MVQELTLDDYRSWMSGAAETTIAGQPAMVSEPQVVVGLPDGRRVLDMAASLDAGDDGLSVTVSEVAQLLAERLLPVIPEA